MTDDYVRLLVRDLRQYGFWTFVTTHSWRSLADLLDELLARREHGRYRRVVEFYHRSDN